MNSHGMCLHRVQSCHSDLVTVVLLLFVFITAFIPDAVLLAWAGNSLLLAVVFLS